MAKIDFKDDILNSTMGGKRQYKLENNSNGTVSLNDVTVYDQVGSDFGAKEANDIGVELNKKSDTNHTHDDRYFTETEVTNLLSGKANSSHTHDDRYFTETEVTNLLNNKQNNLGFTPIQQGGGTGQGTNKVYIGWSGSRLKAQVDNSDQGNIVFDKNLPTSLPANGGNSDTVDGYHVSSGVNAGQYGLRVTQLSTVDIGVGAGLATGELYIVYE